MICIHKQKKFYFHIGESFASANGGNQTIVMTNTGKSAVSFNMTVTPHGIGSVTGAPRTGQPAPPPPKPLPNPHANVLYSAGLQSHSMPSFL